MHAEARLTAIMPMNQHSASVAPLLRICHVRYIMHEGRCRCLRYSDLSSEPAMATARGLLSGRAGAESCAGLAAPRVDATTTPPAKDSPVCTAGPRISQQQQSVK